MVYRIIWGPSKPAPPDGIVSRSFWGRPYACGHRGPKTFTVRVRGAIVQPRANDNWKCPACVIRYIRERSIDCPLCEQPLFPGDLVQPCQDMQSSPVDRAALAGLKLACLRMGCGIAPDPQKLWTWDGEVLLPP